MGLTWVYTVPNLHPDSNAKEHDCYVGYSGMGEALVCGAPWDGRSMVGGCVRDACVTVTTDQYVL